MLYVFSGVIYTYFIVENRNKELMKMAEKLVDREDL